MTTATLAAHVNSDVVTREQLALVPTPEGTNTFRPVPHIDLVTSLDRVIEAAGLTTTEENLALRRDGQMLFGVRKIGGLATADGQGALGFRTANNRTMSIQLVAGLSVFVCDNLVFRGDLIALKRKHTSGLTLESELANGINVFLDHFGTLRDEIGSLQAKPITDVDAKGIIHDVFVKGVMPVRFMPEVSKMYFSPIHVEFEPRTAWSLHNAFTEVAKGMPVTTRFQTTEEIGRLFGMVNNAGREEKGNVLDHVG